MSVTAYRGDKVDIVVPKKAYGANSYKIRPHSDHEWKKENAEELQERLQQIAGVWKYQGTTDYLIYAHKSKRKQAFSGYHVIPYPKNEWSFWQQLKVLWHVTFGASKTDLKEREKVRDIFTDYIDFVDLQAKEEREDAPETEELVDPFCNTVQLDKQYVFDTESFNGLVNFKPLVSGEDELHLLITPKSHHTCWAKLPQATFQEGEAITYRLMNLFQDQEIYFMIHNGERSGQSIDHCHMHFIVVSSQANAFFGKMLILQKMIFGASRLSDTGLKNSVDAAAKKLAPAIAQEE